MDNAMRLSSGSKDGDAVTAGHTLCTIAGPARTLLVAERTLLNFIGHLSGIATLTARYVQAAAGSRARIYDTRKTTPGWRRLEKYAVRCGGGHNHRLGLFDAILMDIVLLDNMSPADLRRAVERRDAIAPSIELEASGGVNLDNVATIAATGIERISVGALTHSARHLDVGLDWK
jgi:nicotinate-nucleotide pyrophosphorylase (carboxylating)